MTPWTGAHQASLSFTVSWKLLRFMFIELVMLSKHVILHHLFSFCLESFPASGSFPLSQLFTSSGQNTGASALISVLPVNIQDLISFRIDCLDLLAVQGTLKSLFQNHSSKASILWCSAFFILQLSHPYMTIGKNHSFD